MSYNQELLEFAIVSFILIPVVFNSGRFCCGKLDAHHILKVKMVNTSYGKGRLILGKGVGRDVVDQFPVGC